jgi:hypothetical protein
MGHAWSVELASGVGQTKRSSSSSGGGKRNPGLTVAAVAVPMQYRRTLNTVSVQLHPEKAFLMQFLGPATATFDSLPKPQEGTKSQTAYIL